MPDKMEREIEEILARLDKDSPRPQEPAPPISIMARRKKAPGRAEQLRRARSEVGSSLGNGILAGISPTTLLFAGAGVMVAGLVLSNFWQPLIWASFAGVVLFLAAFLWSFKRTPQMTSGGGAAGAPAPRGHYWRDRYIEYTPDELGAMSRLKRRFRRK